MCVLASDSTKSSNLRKYGLLRSLINFDFQTGSRVSNGSHPVTASTGAGDDSVVDLSADVSTLLILDSLSEFEEDTEVVVDVVDISFAERFTAEVAAGTGVKNDLMDLLMMNEFVDTNKVTAIINLHTLLSIQIY